MSGGFCPGDFCPGAFCRGAFDLETNSGPHSYRPRPARLVYNSPCDSLRAKIEMKTQTEKKKHSHLHNGGTIEGSP